MMVKSVNGIRRGVMSMPSLLNFVHDQNQSQRQHQLLGYCTGGVAPNADNVASNERRWLSDVQRQVQEIARKQQQKRV